jgi:NodT family efflux transporter outer membrane factor (OMF) lipoprotein
MVGPDYHRPPVEIPESFKEGANWQRARANPEGAISSEWWLAYRDDTLSHLIDDALKANQSIAAAEAAYRLAQATVAASRAALYPTVTTNLSASRSGSGGTTGSSTTGNTTIGSSTTSNTTTRSSTTSSGVSQFVSATMTASWEPDLWGQIRRSIESSKGSAQASDAQLAGQRLSIAASVATDYFALRQLDIDIDLLERERQINARILDMTRASFLQGMASNDMVLIAQDTLEAVIAILQTSKIAREQFEHAIAVLVGVPPANFSIAPKLDYTFAAPPVPLVLPSELLERRFDIVSAERLAAAANARIGVAKAAFFPALNLAATGGFQSNTLASLFSLPNRIWTLGPALAATIFDGGARTAAVHEAQATYDEAVATYRLTVLTAFQNVEDSLSSCNHLQEQANAFADIYHRNQQLFESQRAQLLAGTVSEQNVLTQQLTLLSAEQSLKDTQGLLIQASVTLIKNLGGGWQWDDTKEAAVNPGVMPGAF